VSKEQKEQLIAVLALTVQAGIVLWVNASPWQRQQAIMTLTRALDSAARRPHRAAGRAGMSAELRTGSERAAAGRYELAYWLGRLRERATAWYEQLAA
jgi:hypothetical protein